MAEFRDREILEDIVLNQMEILKMLKKKTVSMKKVETILGRNIKILRTLNMVSINDNTENKNDDLKKYNYLSSVCF